MPGIEARWLGRPVLSLPYQLSYLGSSSSSSNNNNNNNNNYYYYYWCCCYNNFTVQIASVLFILDVLSCSPSSFKVPGDFDEGRSVSQVTFWINTFLYYVNSWDVRTESKKRSKILTKLQIGDFVLDHVEAPKKSFSPEAISGCPVLGCRRLSSDYMQAGRSILVYESVRNGTNKIVFRLYICSAFTYFGTCSTDFTSFRLHSLDWRIPS